MSALLKQERTLQLPPDYCDLIFALVLQTQWKPLGFLRRLHSMGGNWMKFRFALLALATLGGAALPLQQCRWPSWDSSSLRTSRALQWSAVRAVASAQGPCIGAGPTSSAAPNVRRGYGYHRR